MTPVITITERETALATENAALLAANLDLINNFNQVMEDHEALKSHVGQAAPAPKYPEDQPQCPTVAYLHKVHDKYVTTDPAAYDSPYELVRKIDVVDHIDWLEKGIAEWQLETADAIRRRKDLAAEVSALDQRHTDLIKLVHDVHKAKGRHHSQLAMCALYQACGLPFTLPTYGEKA